MSINGINGFTNDDEEDVENTYKVVWTSFFLSYISKVNSLSILLPMIRQIFSVQRYLVHSLRGQKTLANNADGLAVIIVTI